MHIGWRLHRGLRWLSQMDEGRDVRRSDEARPAWSIELRDDEFGSWSKRNARSQRRMVAEEPLHRQTFVLSDMNINNLSSYLKHAAVNTRAIQSLSVKLSFLCSTFLRNNLINAYLHFARFMLGHARELFDKTPHRNVVTWSAIISGYTHIGNLTDALIMFRNIQYTATQDGWSRPNQFTSSTILTGCSHAKDLKTGIHIHCSLIKCGIVSYSFVDSTLIDMYTKCDDVEEAWRVFDQTPYKYVVSWTAMLTCLANSPQPKFRDGAFGLFRDMLLVWPVVMTFASIVKIFDESRKRLTIQRRCMGAW